MNRIALIAGVVLTLAGGYFLWSGGVSYTEEQQVLDVGPVEATAETREQIEVPPLVAGVALVAGVGILVWGAAGSRRS